MLTVSTPATSSSPPYTYSYFVIVTDNGNGASLQSRTAKLTAHRPGGVNIVGWTYQSDITTVSVRLTSWDDGCPVIYRYTTDAGNNWSTWMNSGQTDIQPIIATYWDGTGNIRVEAKDRDSYGCDSTVSTSSWVSF
jgi:hypothetical protein